MNTVPTTPTDAERCDVPWCQQPASHLPENHVRVIAVVGPSTWNIVCGAGDARGGMGRGRPHAGAHPGRQGHGQPRGAADLA